MLHEPRFWPEYHDAYYGAFVRDPDGNNVEAVCHTAQPDDETSRRLGAGPAQRYSDLWSAGRPRGRSLA